MERRAFSFAAADAVTVRWMLRLVTAIITPSATTITLTNVHRKAREALIDAAARWLTSSTVRAVSCSIWSSWLANCAVWASMSAADAAASPVLLMSSSSSR